MTLRLPRFELLELRYCLASGDFISHDISLQAEYAQSVFAGDIDNDGDLDVLSASAHDDKIAWYENVNGLGQFGDPQVISTIADFARMVIAADLDGDGDLEAITASSRDHTVAWYENLDGNGEFGSRRVISASIKSARAVFAADLDGDGDHDILTASAFDDEVAWFENQDGNGNFGVKKTITSDAESARSVIAADVDGDGDLDVLSASSSDDKVAWYENLNGQGVFGRQQIIAISDSRSVFAADMDNDGDIDVLSASTVLSQVSWFENLDGEGTFGPAQIISSTAISAQNVIAADVDGDGDFDAVSASSSDDKIAWYENTDGVGDFAAGRIISLDAKSARAVHAADINADGKIDFVSASAIDDKVAWYENDPSGLIETTGDFNSDGLVDSVDIDLLCAAMRDNSNEPRFDLTGEGSIDDNDLQTLVKEILGTSFGDANLDGTFDSTDLVQIFVAAEYEDNLPNNSGWATGDWNCDQEFDSSDLIVAFVDGEYVQ